MMSFFRSNKSTQTCNWSCYIIRIKSYITYIASFLAMTFSPLRLGGKKHRHCEEQSVIARNEASLRVFTPVPTDSDKQRHCEERSIIARNEASLRGTKHHCEERSVIARNEASLRGTKRHCEERSN